MTRRVKFFAKTTKEKLFDFDNVRWQGTAEPKAKGFEYQPYDRWVVPINAGRTRLLYIALRSVKKNKPRHIYVHNDRTYKSSKWTRKEMLLDSLPCYVCITLWSSSFDPKDFWFDFDGDNLSQLKRRPKGIVDE